MEGVLSQEMVMVVLLVGGGMAVLGALFGALLSRRNNPAPPAAQPQAQKAAPPPAPAPDQAEATGAAPENTAAPAPDVAPKEDTTPPAPRPNPVMENYQRVLEQKGIPAKELDTRMRDFAHQYKDLSGKLAEVSPAAPEMTPLVEGARTDLSEGRFQEAIGALEELGTKGEAGGQQMMTQAVNHLVMGAKAKAVAGDLQLAQLSYEEAAGCYAKAVDLLPDSAENLELRAELLNKHGTAAYQAGDLEAATASFEAALRILERVLGPEHPDVATGLNNLALLHYSQANYQAAEPLYKRALLIDEKALGAEHPGVATDLNNLALLYKKQGNLEAAEPLFRRALYIKERIFDPGHPSLVTGLKNYAALLRALGRGDDAKTLETRAAALPPKRTEGAAPAE